MGCPSAWPRMSHEAVSIALIAAVKGPPRQRTPAVEVFPVCFDGRGISSDELLTQLQDRRRNRFFLAAEMRLTEADQPLIRIDLHEGRARSHHEHLDVRDS